MDNKSKLVAIARPEWGEPAKSVWWRLVGILGWRESRVQESWYGRAVWTKAEHEQVDALLDEIEFQQAEAEELRHAIEDLRSRLDRLAGGIQGAAAARALPAFDWLCLRRSC